MLTAEQRERYCRDGFIIVERALAPDQVSRLRQVTSRIIEGARGVVANDPVYDLEDSHTPDTPRVRRIKAPHKVDPFFAELVRSTGILEPVKDLLGPSVRFLNSKLNMKSAGYGAAVEWHQDWAFYPYTNDAVLAVGVMLDDVTLDNGPMLVLPGSHRGPVYDHNADGHFCGAFDPKAAGLDVSGAVPILGAAGSISLHHVRCVHGSDLNRSGRDRRFLLYELAAGDAWPLAGCYAHWTDWPEFNARLLCGEPTNQPRLAAVPVRMPQPGALDSTSIYASQKSLERRSFAVA
jgi:ectoine hydroxylase-related dioxygenase (phytanoyl-CoA dioxygenase family)